MEVARPLLYVLLAALGIGVGMAMRADAKTSCGNLKVEVGEDCDHGGESATCDDDCTEVECGDENLNEAAGETCDDGGTANGDGCSSTCQLTCGNGTVDEGEGCDTTVESAKCDDDCSIIECGDGNVNETAGEYCDDGNTVPHDGCSRECQSDPSFPIPSPGQACVNAINKNLAGVARAQAADTAACLKAAARGTSAFGDCHGADRTGKVGKARARTTATFGRKCAGAALPHFAITTPTAVSDAGETAVLEGTTILLGAAPTIAPKSDKVASACQAEALKHYAAIFDAWVTEANKAKKTALKGAKSGAPPPVASGPELAAALDAALADNAKVGKAVAKADAALANQCTQAVIAPHFDCGGAATTQALRSCVSAAARASACGAMEAADDLDLACPAVPL